MIIKVFAAAILFVVLATHGVLAERRVALIIGNGAYTNATPLINPVNDARAFANKMQRLGFETIVGYDLDKSGVDKALRSFAKASRQADVNVFFYAGHGMSVGGRNYLVPTDAAFEDEVALDFEAVPVDAITRQMSYSDAVNLVFLDACRDNPLSRTLARSMGGSTRSTSIENGLSEIKIDNAGKGLAIAFATSPGDVALDGEGSHSPFTEALLKHIDAENTDILEVFSRVTGDVFESTGQRQRPWLNTSLTGSVVLNKVEPVALATTTAPVTADTGVAAQPITRSSNLEEQKLLFELARETGDVEDYRAYLDTFPAGIYANNARRTIEKLSKTRMASIEATGTVITNQPAPSVQPTRSINEYGALVLPVTSSLRQVPASEFTEDELNLDRQKKGEIQSRLNAAGVSVGVVDGLWGKGTRRGISGWQSRNGLTPSGYFNPSQLELLVSQTEGRYEPYIVKARKAVVRRKTTQSNNSNRSNNVRQQPKRDDAPEAGLVGRFIGGVLRELAD